MNLYQRNRLINEENKLKIEFEIKQHMANLSAYKIQLKQLERSYSNESKTLVSDFEISKLFDKISQAGLSSGLIIERFTPASPANKENKGVLLITMEVVGDYSALVAFLSKLANFNQLISLHEFEIKADNLRHENKSLHMRLIAKIHRGEK
jgi:type IV pilus assembly protein PilO